VVLLLALSTGHKLGLGLAGAAFAAFALVVSMVVPRRWPQFPGRRLWPFVGLCFLLFIGMLAAVEIFGASSEEHAEAGRPHATTPALPKGSPSKGKALFASEGCASCHTFKPAGSTAKIGPDLDKLAEYAQQAGRGSLEQFTAESITDPGAYVQPGYSDGVMPTTFGKLPKAQIADLVAFVTGK
jgi:mono/diheme cytochrome c family protein